jgi:hypothetical protein
MLMDITCGPQFFDFKNVADNLTQDTPIGRPIKTDMYKTGMLVFNASGVHVTTGATDISVHVRAAVQLADGAWVTDTTNEVATQVLGDLDNGMYRVPFNTLTANGALPGPYLIVSVSGTMGTRASPRVEGTFEIWLELLAV